MTKEEMIVGFSEGRTLCQALYHPYRDKPTVEELNLVEECIKNGLCTVTPWFDHPTDGIMREMTGIIKNEQSQHD